jgi:putative spermidine/putrescine transport system permease protein
MELTNKRNIWLSLFGGLVAAWLFLPTLVVLPMSLNASDRLSIWPDDRSLRLYGSFFGNPMWYGSTLRSIGIALAVSCIATVFGTAAAFAINRGFTGRRARGALGAFLLAPLILPVVVAAIASYLVYLRWGLVGTFYGLIAAHTCVAIPFVLVPVLAALQSVERRLEHAAQSLGATPAEALRLVTLPLIRSALLVGFFLAFMASFDEVVLSIFLTGPGFQTLPIQMYSALVEITDPTIAAAASVVLIFTFAAIALIGVGRLARARSIGTESVGAARGEGAR